MPSSTRSAKADDWGLRARDFALPQLRAGANTPEAAAATEMALTFAVLKYARHARGGRLGDLPSISKVLDYRPPVRRPADVLTDIAASYAPDADWRSLHPQHEQFQALRRLLLKLRGSDVTASVEPGREDRTVHLGRILVNMERWRWLPAESASSMSGTMCRSFSRELSGGARPSTPTELSQANPIGPRRRSRQT